MNAVAKGIRTENGELRGLLGSGEPGLFTLLGGSSEELEGDRLRMTGGPGQVSGTSRVARAHKDVRLAAVASGTLGSTGTSTSPRIVSHGVGRVRVEGLE